MYFPNKDIVRNDVESIKSVTFSNICNVLTSSDHIMLNSIDYVTGMIVNESYEIHQDIIDKVIINEHRDECTKDLVVAKTFIKNQLKNHIKKDDDGYFVFT